MDKLVIIPDKPTKMIWDFCINAIYAANIFMILGFIAFHMLTYEHFYKFDIAMDFIFFFDMLLYFFTAYEMDNETTQSG
jgi:hypothetical protein